ncbi:MAG TPA: nucleoside hydrolase [Acidimicrobiia bacterium]
MWIDTDAGDSPDDTIALWCAARATDVDVAGVSTVDGDVELRAVFVRNLLPGIDVIAGPPPPARVENVDVLLGIGPWTHVADLADAGALPRRVVLMGGALAPIKHRGELLRIEHNVGADPESAARLLRTTGNLIVLPLDATARLHAHAHDEEVLTEAVPGLREQLDLWRQENGDEPVALHDVAALLVALGDPMARMESRRLQIEPDGTMGASVDGPLQYVVAHVNSDETRARMRGLALEGG